MTDDNWIRDTITPKSDQLNADDLVAGPITVTITAVKPTGDQQQPAAISIGADLQPYKPCKTMRRLLVQLWGDDVSIWVGRQMTLYCDPDVRYGGQQVGGIRICNVSHIDKAVSVPVTVSRGKRSKHTVQPIQTAPEKPETVLDKWRPRLKGISASESALFVSHQIAEAFTSKSTATLDDSHKRIGNLHDAAKEQWGKLLTDFAADVLAAIAEEG